MPLSSKHIYTGTMTTSDNVYLYKYWGVPSGIKCRGMKEADDEESEAVSIETIPR